MEQNTPRKNKDRSLTIEIDAITKRHLKFFMQQELAYYNMLINNATMRLRAFPEEFLGLKDGYERLWCTLAFHGKSIRELARMPLSRWPKDLRSSLPSACIAGDKLQVSEKKMMLFDIVSVRGNIHPQMRKVLAAEMLRYMIPQAEQLVQSQKNSTGQMRSPVQMLMSYDYPEKRHIQLAKELVAVTYDADNKCSLIKVPYTDRPLVVRDSNLTSDRFDVLVIRQQPNIDVNDDTPWHISMINSPHRYLLDLTDQHMHATRRRRGD